MSSDDTTPEALLIDMGGVLYERDDPIDGAADTVAWLTDQGIPHRFLTNTTSRPRSGLVDKLAGLGIEVEADAILTPPVAAAAWLREHEARRLALLVPDATKSEFADFTEADRDVDAVVVGDLGEAWDFHRLNHAFQLLMSERRPPLVALGMSRYFRAGGELRLDAAPFVVALSHASGVEPQVLGKPAAAFFHSGLEALGVDARQTMMIGDDLVTDVGGAQDAGIRGMLVRTGKYQGEDRSAAVTPYAVLDSFADLPRWWRDQDG